MKLGKVIKLLSNWTPRHPPLMLWGPPGVGKSQIVKQAAHERGIGLVEVYLTQIEPTDLRGVLWVVNGESKWLTPSVLPKDGKGFLFFDELCSAPPTVQNAVHQLVCFRCVGEYRLPDEWMIVAASNRTTDLVQSQISGPMANRFVHINVEADIKAFTEWALKNDIDPMIISFLNAFPENLIEKPRKGPFASPRTWEFLSRIGLQSECIAGCVGDGIAAKFLQWLRSSKQVLDLFNRFTKGEVKVEKLELEPLFTLNFLIISRRKQVPKDCLFRYLLAVPPEAGVHLLLMLNKHWRNWFDESWRSELEKKYARFEELKDDGESE